MTAGRKRVPPDTIRSCNSCDYTGRADTFPPSRRYQDGYTSYRHECRACHNKKNRDRRRNPHPTTRPADKRTNHGRRIDAVKMIKFLTKDIDRPTPQERMRVADIIVTHYREYERGEVNHMIMRVLRANGRVSA